MKLQLRLAHKCICGALRDEDAISERRLEIQLFGCVPENVCPSCFRLLDPHERKKVHARWRALQ